MNVENKLEQVAQSGSVSNATSDVSGLAYWAAMMRPDQASTIGSDPAVSSTDPSVVFRNNWAVS